MSDYLNWSVEKLRRKADQEWVLAQLTRQDGDTADERRHIDLALKYDARLKELR